MTCLKQGIKAVKLTSVMRTFPDELARVTMKTKSTRQRGEQRDSEGATRYAPKKNTFIHVLTTTPETNRTTTCDEEGHTPSSSYLPFRHAMSRGIPPPRR